jgi:protein SCO1/2
MKKSGFLSPNFRFFICTLAVLLGVLLGVQSQVVALEHPGTELEEVGVMPILGHKVDLDLPFTTSDGVATTLRALSKPGRPFILVPAYYHCPRLCGLVLSGVVELIDSIKLHLGSDFEVITYSFDSSEDVVLATKNATKFKKLLTKPISAESWPFLIGSEQSVKALSDQIGFHFKRDGAEFAHTSAIILLTPEGEISQYFTGISYPAWDVKLALVEASKGNIGSTMDHILLYCFRFDPTKGKYTWAVFGLLKVGGALTILLLGGLIIKLLRAERASSAKGFPS